MKSNHSDETSLNVSEVISDEVLRYRIRKMIDAPPPASALKRLSANPLITLVIGFILTGVVGAYLTRYYDQKQRDIEAHRQEVKTQMEIIENINRIYFTYRAAANFMTYEFEKGQENKSILDKRISTYDDVSQTTNRDIPVEALRVRLFFKDEQLYAKLAGLWRTLFILDAEITAQIKEQGYKTDSNPEHIEEWKAINNRLVMLTNEVESILREMHTRVGATP